MQIFDKKILSIDDSILFIVSPIKIMKNNFRGSIYFCKCNNNKFNIRFKISTNKKLQHHIIIFFKNELDQKIVVPVE